MNGRSSPHEPQFRSNVLKKWMDRWLMSGYSWRKLHWSYTLNIWIILNRISRRQNSSFCSYLFNKHQTTQTILNPLAKCIIDYQVRYAHVLAGRPAKNSPDIDISQCVCRYVSIVGIIIIIKTRTRRAIRAFLIATIIMICSRTKNIDRKTETDHTEYQ